MKRIDFKNKRNKYIRILQDLKRPVKGLQKYDQKGVLAKSLFDVIKNLFYDKSWLFSKESTWHRSPWEEMGQKWDFRALFSEILLSIVQFFYV